MWILLPLAGVCLLPLLFIGTRRVRLPVWLALPLRLLVALPFAAGMMLFLALALLSSGM